LAKPYQKIIRLADVESAVDEALEHVDEVHRTANGAILAQ
jgi:hypothetical protein